MLQLLAYSLDVSLCILQRMGAGTGGAGWASAHPGKNQGGHGPPWKF